MVRFSSSRGCHHHCFAFGPEQLHLEVHGLLKIRGEINKSDVVAGLLASKAGRSSTRGHS